MTEELAQDFLNQRLVLVEDKTSQFQAFCLVAEDGTVLELFPLSHGDVVRPLAEAVIDITEELTKGDREEIEKIAVRAMKGEKFSDAVLKISKNVVTSLFRSLYNRRGLWKNELSADNQA